MKHIVLVADSKGYLQDALTRGLTQLGYEVTVSPSDMMSLQNSYQQIDCFIFFTSDRMSFTMTAALYIKEKVESGIIPCFIIGNAPDIDAIMSTFPNMNVLREFKRPIDIKVVLSDISYYLNTFIETTKHKVLVVDDSGQMLRNVKEWLEGRYSVKLANSGLDAIRQITEVKPELILLDYDMPVCNGPQVLEMLQEDPQMSDIPVIFLTGNDDPDDVRKAVSLHPAGYILKSQGSAEIIGHVDSFFSRLDSK